MNINQINVVGLGYVGLPAALQLANNGYKVVGTDLNVQLIDQLKKGNLSFEEEGMKEELKKAINNHICFTSQYEKSDVYIIAVPTNFDKKTKKIDPIYLISAMKEIVNVCKDEAIVVIESTVSPGTIKTHLYPLIKNTKISLAHAPERILPGNTLKELVMNDRVIGADDPEIQETVRMIYSSFCKGTIHTTDLQTAEMTKVIENSFRDVNIAYANELKKICQLMGIDVNEAIQLANHHPRVNILNPSAGVGGHCISVDPWFLVGDFPEAAKLIASARSVNDSMPMYTWDRLKKLVGNKKIGIYGLTYKENIDDIRESPALQLYNNLSDKEKETLHVFDPYVNKQILPKQSHNFEEFLYAIDVVLVMAPHSHLEENLPSIQTKKIDIYDPYNKIPGAIKI